MANFKVPFPSGDFSLNSTRNQSISPLSNFIVYQYTEVNIHIHTWRGAGKERKPTPLH